MWTCSPRRDNLTEAQALIVEDYAATQAYKNKRKRDSIQERITKKRANLFTARVGQQSTTFTSPTTVPSTPIIPSTPIVPSHVSTPTASASTSSAPTSTSTAPAQSTPAPTSNPKNKSNRDKTTKSNKTKNSVPAQEPDDHGDHAMEE